jgi:plastocyanin
MTRQLAILCSLSLLAAACGSATGPSTGTASATSTPAPSGGTASPAPLTPTATPRRIATVKVSIGDNFFAPDEVTVAVGSTVTWQIDAGENPHDIAATDGSFRSNSPMNRGDIFSYTFTKAGEYAYVCSFHIPEGMRGKVIVR